MTNDVSRITYHREPKYGFAPQATLTTDAGRPKRACELTSSTLSPFPTAGV